MLYPIKANNLVSLCLPSVEGTSKRASLFSIQQKTRYSRNRRSQDSLRRFSSAMVLSKSSFRASFLFALTFCSMPPWHQSGNDPTFNIISRSYMYNNTWPFTWPSHFGLFLQSWRTYSTQCMASIWASFTTFTFIAPTASSQLKSAACFEYQASSPTISFYGLVIVKQMWID